MGRKVVLGRALAVALSLVLVGLAPGCGGSDVGSEDDPTAVPDEWVRHQLGSIGGDSRMVATSVGDAVAVVSVDQGMQLRAHLVGDDGSLVEGTVAAGPPRPQFLTAIAGGADGLVAFGNVLEPEIRAFVLTSPDGVEWVESRVTGLEEPATLTGATATADGYVVVGYRRTGGNGNGPFSPLVATSPDGLAWSVASLPGADGDGEIRSVATVGARLLVAGTVDQESVAWVSSDGGRTWSVGDDVPPVDLVVAIGGDSVLAAVEGQMGELESLHRSNDAGASWEVVEPDVARGLQFVSLWTGPGGIGLQGSARRLQVWSEPEVCYVDIEACGPLSGGPADETVLVSVDGSEWGGIDLAVLPGLRWSRSVIRTSADGIVVVGMDEGGWSAWVWPGDRGEAPSASPDDQEVAAYEGPRFVRYGDPLTQGERVAFPLYIHCGMGHLWEFDGRPWELVESPTGAEPETGSGEPVPAGWPVVDQTILGFLTLVAPDRIEYSLEGGEVIGVYAPMPEGELPSTCQ